MKQTTLTLHTRNTITENMFTILLSLSRISHRSLTRAFWPSRFWENLCHSNRKIKFSKNKNMDSNTYTRLFELPNKQTYDKPLDVSAPANIKNLKKLQSPYFNGHERSIFPVTRWKLLRLRYSRRLHTLRCSSPFSQKRSNKCIKRPVRPLDS